MAISDLTGTTWVFNNILTSSLDFSYSLDFKDMNNLSYDSLMHIIVPKVEYNSLTYSSQDVYDFNTSSWYDNAYKTITITGGTDATNASLIAWLEANATQQLPAQPAQTSFKTISYNSTTKVLTINGVDYTLASTASGETVSCGSFGEVSLTSAGVLTINGTEITLPLILPENLILDVNGDIIKASDGYLITNEN